MPYFPTTPTFLVRFAILKLRGSEKATQSQTRAWSDIDTHGGVQPLLRGCVQPVAGVVLQRPLRASRVEWEASNKGREDPRHPGWRTCSLLGRPTGGLESRAPLQHPTARQTDGMVRCWEQLPSRLADPNALYTCQSTSTVGWGTRASPSLAARAPTAVVPTLAVLSRTPSLELCAGSVPVRCTAAACRGEAVQRLRVSAGPPLLQAPRGLRRPTLVETTRRPCRGARATQRKEGWTCAGEAAAAGGAPRGGSTARPGAAKQAEQLACWRIDLLEELGQRDL